MLADGLPTLVFLTVRFTTTVGGGSDREVRWFGHLLGMTSQRISAQMGEVVSHISSAAADEMLATHSVVVSLLP